MKCSECSRRNHEDNSFCIYCGSALTTKSTSKEVSTLSPAKAKIMVPPQDIDEIINSRHTAHYTHTSSSIVPLVALVLTIMLGLSGVYYYFFYADVFQILAIDYQTTNLINE